MGYMRHHAIVVTSWSAESIEKAHSQAAEMFRWVSPVSPEATNGYRSFFIPPDGSKEGWAESNIGNMQRTAFMDWCDAQAYEDGSNNLSFAEVLFGDDEHKVGVTRSDVDRYPLTRKSDLDPTRSEE